jgi:hypothetical protein
VAVAADIEGGTPTTAATGIRDSKIFMTNSSLTRLAGWAAIITSLTTIGVHYVTIPGATFDERIARAQESNYIAHKWMIIFHCIPSSSLF